jgi:hypothetical protein
MTDQSADAAIARSLEAYASLTDLGEEVDDEWTYVTDLARAWQDRLDEVAVTRAGQPIDASADAAIDRAIDEIARIEDPHRAIDWLSTFPQVVLIALGEST